jgi:hypothetical protein
MTPARVDLQVLLSLIAMYRKSISPYKNRVLQCLLKTA